MNCWRRSWRLVAEGGRGYRAAGVDERAAPRRCCVAGWPGKGADALREMPERIWHEVALAREDASPCLRLGDFTVRRYQQRLWWVNIPARRIACCVARLAPAAALPDGLGELMLRPAEAARRRGG
jgi:tRNA(Ile)-lysidine synthase